MLLNYLIKYFKIRLFEFRYNLPRNALSQSKKILEIGCGRGEFAFDFVKYFNCEKYVAIDIFINSASNSKLIFVEKSIQNIDLNDLRDIQVIFAFNILEHISYEDFLVFLRKISTVNSKFTIYGVCPNPQSLLGLYSQFNDHTHLTIYSPKILYDLCSKVLFDDFKFSVSHARYPLPKTLMGVLGYFFANLIGFLTVTLQYLYQSKFKVGSTDFFFQISKE